MGKLSVNDVMAARHRGELDSDQAAAILAANFSPIDLADQLVNAFDRGGIRPLFCDEDGIPHGQDRAVEVIDPPVDLNVYQRAALIAYGDRTACNVGGLSEFSGTESEFRAALNRDGDGLISLLVDELSTREGCSDEEAAMQRLSMLQESLQIIEDSVACIDADEGDAPSRPTAGW